jgi:hypothetical protein
MNVVVLNCGSSSVLFQVIDADLDAAAYDADRRFVQFYRDALYMPGSAASDARLWVQNPGRIPVTSRVEGGEGLYADLLAMAEARPMVAGRTRDAVLLADLGQATVGEPVLPRQPRHRCAPHLLVKVLAR